MKYRLDRRLLCFLINARGQQGVVDLPIGHVLFVEQRQQRGQATFDDVFLSQSAETGATGFDEVGVFGQAR